ncbi:cell division topological specificity factor MinE [Azospirillum sp. TSH58]|uniref:Cell division topological specificity factor n=1 Tax=Azospirillum brasilense TaxID=192 RepID=A0A4D8QWZ3_AZOBR|nr:MULTISPECIES: cell division topological specificity factor MinE [Azospirillum]AWJ83452.1 cell division topological specificity factor MinE [Azospirillum sp. TSH58]PWC73192.1 cell division topological specificity factor [Azospirillum sp. TSH58]QCO15755.1 cell division topological specificity factor MinE [Azospirillum brasilense]
MSIFSFFRSAPRASAVQAKERLQIVMAHERAGRTGPDYLPMLQQELLAVIAKYIDIDQNKVEVKLDRGGDCSTLELNIELPAREAAAKALKESAKLAVAGNRPAAKDADESDPVKLAAGGSLTNGGVKKRR